MKKPYTIITDNYEQCFICGSYQMIEWHHIFPASNRKKSTEYGCVVPLCKYCHNEPPNGVHQNRQRMDWLKAIGQKRFNEVYPELDFMQIFKKNYL